MNARLALNSLGEAGYAKKTAQQKKQIDALIVFEEKYKGKTVLANYYQLGRAGKEFSLEFKKLIREDMPVESTEYIKTNWHWDSCGKLFEVDEVGTEKMWKERGKLAKKAEERDMLQRETGRVFTEAIKSVSETAKVNVEADLEDKPDTTAAAIGAPQKELQTKDSFIESYVKEFPDKFKSLEAAKASYEKNQGFKDFVDQKVLEANL